MNAGYKRGGKALRCDGESHEPKLFDTYSPKAMASIGGLRGALLDRCIAEARRNGGLSPGPYDYGFLTRWFIATIEPPAKRRFPAPSRYLPPPADVSRETALRR